MNKLLTGGRVPENTKAKISVIILVDSVYSAWGILKVPIMKCYAMEKLVRWAQDTLQ